jgi:hypothetical protein
MARQPLVRSRERGAGVRQNAGQSERLQRKAARRHRTLRCAGAARSRGLRPLHSRLRIRGRSTRGAECEAVPFGAKMARQPLVRSRERGAGVRQNAGQSERLQRKAARRHRALGCAGAARCAAPGPLVPAAFGRSTRGSESVAAPFGSPMALQPMVRSRERGAGVRRTPARVSGHSARPRVVTAQAASRHRALGCAGAARSRGLRPLHSRL